MSLSFRTTRNVPVAIDSGITSTPTRPRTPQIQGEVAGQQDGVRRHGR
jgi:hypothetical protein